MQIMNNSPRIPQRLEVRAQSQDAPPPQDPQDQGPDKPAIPAPESFGKKALRVAGRTALGAGYGYLGGMISQQPGMVGTLGTVYLGVHGLGAGASAGWQVGKRVGLMAASGNGNEIAKGGLALGATFGGPLVGGVAGVAAGIAAAAGGPLVAAGVFGGIALVTELAR